jgi:hypothetical protein
VQCLVSMPGGRSGEWWYGVSDHLPQITRRLLAPLHLFPRTGSLRSKGYAQRSTEEYGRPENTVLTSTCGIILGLYKFGEFSLKGICNLPKMRKIFLLSCGPLFTFRQGWPGVMVSSNKMVHQKRKFSIC